MPGAAGAKSASAEAQSAARQKELNAVGTLLREAVNLQGRLAECGSGNEALADLASAADLDTEVRSWALSELSSADERFAALVAEAQLMADDNALTGGVWPAALRGCVVLEPMLCWLLCEYFRIPPCAVTCFSHLDR